MRELCRPVQPVSPGRPGAAVRVPARSRHDVEDLDIAERAMAAITGAVESLQRSPFVYRKADADPFLRELLIPFSSSGYVALFEIEDAATVTILAVRHQLEDDYH